MRKKKAHSAPPDPKSEPKPVPKYAVCWWGLDMMSRSWGDDRKCWNTRTFDTADDAVKYAEGRTEYSPRIFGLNPEYEYEVTRTMRVKP